jgi:hypothetical protein
MNRDIERWSHDFMASNPLHYFRHPSVENVSVTETLPRGITIRIAHMSHVVCDEIVHWVLGVAYY